jgi:RNA polymerase sigma-70 factor (ECF subfamily)
MGWVRLGARIPGASLRPVDVNGAPGALLLDGDARVIGVWALEFSGGQIIAMNSIINPDKLRHLGPVADVSSLLRLAARGRS